MLRIKYYTGTENFGDELNRYIFENLLKIPVHPINESWDDDSHLMFIGSMIKTATPNTWIWGAGLIDEHKLPAKPPAGISCVRGPLTKRRLVHQGMLKPDQNITLGDPALILSFLSPIRPNMHPKYDIGLIPHYADKTRMPEYSKRNLLTILNNKILRQNQGVNIESELSFDNFKVKIIDIQHGSCEQVIKQICDCAFVASSSLHGLIVSDALGIPNTWIKMSDNLVGGAFKFIDYMMSVGRYDVNPLLYKQTKIDKSFIEKAMDRRAQWSIDFDFISYKADFDSFISSDTFRKCRQTGERIDAV